MLRTVRPNYVGIRLVPGYVQFTAGVPAITRFKGNFSAVTDVGTGHARFTLKDKGAEILGVLTTSESVGHFSNSAGVPAHTQINIKNYDGTTSTADANVHFCAVVADQRNPECEPLARHTVNAAMTGGEVMALKIDTDTGTFVDSTGHSRDFTLTKNDTGDVTITFVRPFQFAPVVIATVDAITATVAVTESAKNYVRLQRVAASDDTTANDGVISVLIFGQYASSYQGGHVRRALKNSRLKARLIPFSFSETALNFGSEAITEGTIGTGSWEGTFKKPFVVAPIVIAVPSVNNSITAATTTVSTTSFVIDTASSSGSGTGSTGGVDGLILGWMDNTVEPRF